MEFTPQEREVFGLHDGDILLSEASGSADEVGKAAIWTGAITPCCFQNTVIRFRPQAMRPRYALHLFNFFALTGTFARASRGVGIHHIGAQRFETLEVPLPPLPEQERIADRVDQLTSDLAAGVAALERVRKKLVRYRSAVLHAAVTGRLTAEWRKQHGPPKETGEQLLARILIERRALWEKRTLAKYQINDRSPPKNWERRYPEPATPTPQAAALPTGYACLPLQVEIFVLRNVLFVPLAHPFEARGILDGADEVLHRTNCFEHHHLFGRRSPRVRSQGGRLPFKHILKGLELGGQSLPLPRAAGVSDRGRDEPIALIPVGRDGTRKDDVRSLTFRTSAYQR
jgi:hypothetical protein